MDNGQHDNEAIPNSWWYSCELRKLYKKKNWFISREIRLVNILNLFFQLPYFTVKFRVSSCDFCLVLHYVLEFRKFFNKINKRLYFKWSFLYFIYWNDISYNYYSIIVINYINTDQYWFYITVDVFLFWSSKYDRKSYLSNLSILVITVSSN